MRLPGALRRRASERARRCRTTAAGKMGILFYRISQVQHALRGCTAWLAELSESGVHTEEYLSCPCLGTLYRPSYVGVPSLSAVEYRTSLHGFLSNLSRKQGTQQSLCSLIGARRMLVQQLPTWVGSQGSHSPPIETPKRQKMVQIPP